MSRNQVIDSLVKELLRVLRLVMPQVTIRKMLVEDVVLLRIMFRNWNPKLLDFANGYSALLFPCLGLGERKKTTWRGVIYTIGSLYSRVLN
jgi:hypothetical protein